MELINQLVDRYEEDLIKSTQDIVRIKSVEEEAKPKMPFGEGPYKALEFALKLSEEMGFKVKNFDNYAGHAEFGEGDETVGVLVHLDVVPEGEGWTYPPYEAEIHNGKIYGRGTNDDKGPAMASLYAMKALKESGLKLSKKIRIIFGTDEESGWKCMEHYFKHEKAPDMGFTPDASFPVIYGEKGIIIFDLYQNLESNKCNGIVIESILGGNAANMVADYCEALISVDEPSEIGRLLDGFIEKTKYPLSLEKVDEKVKIIARGISAHGSTPEKGENAISYLMAFLETIVGDSCDLSKFIKLYNNRIGFKHHGELIGCGFEDEISGKLNFNPGIIKSDDKEIRLTINVRYPIESSSQEVYSGIRNNLQDTDIELVEGDSEQKPLYVAKDNFLVEKLMEIYRKQTGDMESEPITIGGGTYARVMDNAVAFGPGFPGSEDVAHQKDEYISIEDLIKISKIYANALYELAR